MTTLRRLFSGLCLGLLAIAGFTGAAAAQDYPNRPIELMVAFAAGGSTDARSEEHTSELQSLMRISYAVFCLKKKKKKYNKLIPNMKICDHNKKQPNDSKKI